MTVTLFSSERDAEIVGNLSESQVYLRARSTGYLTERALQRSGLCSVEERCREVGSSSVWLYSSGTKPTRIQY